MCIRDRGKKRSKKKPAAARASQGGGAIAGQPPRHEGGTPPKPAYLASSTEGAPPAPPSLVKAVEKGDEAKVKKVFKKLTVGKSKSKGKGRKKKGGTPTDFNAPVVDGKHDGEKAPLLVDAAISGHLGVLELLLRIEGIKVNRASEPHGWTPLYAAACKDHAECVARLLAEPGICLLYTSPSPRDATLSRMPSSA